MSLHTIGYGGVLWPAFVDALAEAGVQVVVDVRLTPWSKSAPCYRRDDLALALAQLGIGYAHDGDLGNPHQEECRADKSLAPYRQHLLAHPHAMAAVRQLLASGLTVALLCGCPAGICHRLVRGWWVWWMTTTTRPCRRGRRIGGAVRWGGCWVMWPRCHRPCLSRGRRGSGGWTTWYWGRCGRSGRRGGESSYGSPSP